MTPTPVLRVSGLRKDYHALRPLRVRSLELARSETVAILGLDQAAAEVLVNVITAATLPDDGEIAIFGESTRAITEADAWYQALDRFGILSERVVLIDELTVIQNLTLPLSIDVHAPDEEIRARVAAVAAEVGISAEEAAKPIGAVGPATRLRTRLGKALALNPDVLLAEHPSATISSSEAQVFARALAAIASRRGIAMLVLTADAAFAGAACHTVLTLQPSTGDVVPAPASVWRRWFGR